MGHLTYLASPYSDPSLPVRTERFNCAVHTVAWFLRQGLFVYSPIAHNHHVVITRDLGRDWSCWEAYDLEFLSRCDSLTVLTLPGWKESVEVQAEIRFAEQKEMMVDYLQYEDMFKPKTL